MQRLEYVRVQSFNWLVLLACMLAGLLNSRLSPSHYIRYQRHLKMSWTLADIQHNLGNRQLFHAVNIFPLQFIFYSFVFILILWNCLIIIFQLSIFQDYYVPVLLCMSDTNDCILVTCKMSAHFSADGAEMEKGDLCFNSFKIIVPKCA